MSDNIFGTTSTSSLISVAEAALEVMREGSVLDIKDADKWGKEIQDGIDAPWAGVEKSTLGGDENVALMIKISLDPKEDWNNKIYQNSRFAMIRLGANGEMEMFASHRNLKNMRKTKFKSPKDVISKINTWIKKVDEEFVLEENKYEMFDDKPAQELDKEMKKAMKMKSYEVARAHIGDFLIKLDKKYPKAGVLDTEPRSIVTDMLNKKFRTKHNLHYADSSDELKSMKKLNTWNAFQENYRLNEALNPLGGKPFEDLRSVADVALKIMTGQPQEVKEEEKTVESEEKPQELTEEIV